MKILFLGDIVGESGCFAIEKNLPDIIKNKKINFVIVNGENAAKEGVFLPPEQFEITSVVVYGDYYRVKGFLLLERFACSRNLFCHIQS